MQGDIIRQSKQLKIHKSHSLLWQYLSKQPPHELIIVAGVEQQRQKNTQGAVLTGLQMRREVGGSSL